MFGIGLRYGLVAGALAISVLVFGIFSSNGQSNHGFASVWFGYTVMLVALSTIFLAIRDYRNNKLGGVIKFFPALGLGVLISAIAGIIYVLGWEAYEYATHYAFADEYAASMIEHARAAGRSVEAATAQAEAFKTEYANPLYRMPMTFLEIFPVGLLIALISAALLRNPKVLPARATA
ncbi:MAG: DUF4199 domain-containing protein [Terricaulis sp.]